MRCHSEGSLEVDFSSSSLCVTDHLLGTGKLTMRSWQDTGVTLVGTMMKQFRASRTEEGAAAVGNSESAC